MKKFFSLALALALCLSLSIPAHASIHDIEIIYPNGEIVQDGGSGEGWASGDDGLTLNGAKDLQITAGASPTIVLAPGSKNTLVRLIGGDADYTNDMTIKGTGELVIYSPTPYDFWEEYGAFCGIITNLKLEDGLTITGGANAGDSQPLTVQPVYTDPVNGSIIYALCTPDKKPARYVRIAPAEPSLTGFTDVANSSPYAEAIKWAVDQKITSGITATTFGPGNTCTVSHILTFLWRANGRPGDNGTERDSVANWAANTLGVDTSNLSAPCTRAMAVTYLWKAAGSPAPSKTASFTDVASGAEYAQAVAWAVEKGITSGTTATTFAPNNTCTRGQIVTFLYRSMK